MMSRLSLYCLLLLSFSCVISSCGEEDLVLPLVVINTPTDAQMYNVNGVVELTATVTDDKKLKRITLKSNLGFEQEIKDFDSDTRHEVSTNIFFDVMTPPGPYAISVIAIDDNDNEYEDSVVIIVNQ